MSEQTAQNAQLQLEDSNARCDEQKKQRIHSKEINIGDKAALSVKEAGFYVGLGKVSFWSLRRSDPTFPKPITVSKFPKFLRSDLDEWLQGKKNEAIA